MRKQGFSFFPWGIVQILLLMALPACSTTPAPTPTPEVTGPRILDVEANAASVGRYEKLELVVARSGVTVTVDGLESGPYLIRLYDTWPSVRRLWRRGG